LEDRLVSTHWSIARAGKDREVTASGIGWELFCNYLIAKEKFRPDFFLYENNKSAAQAIKDQIGRELGVELTYINSAKVSAQNRERFYCVNWQVEQPEDRGITLDSILEPDPAFDEVWYELDSVHDDGTSRIGTITNNAKNQAKHDSKQYRVYSPYGKACTICGEGGGVGAKTGLYAVPFNYLSEKEMDYMIRETTNTRNHFDFGFWHNATRDKSSCVTANTHKGVPYNVLVRPAEKEPSGKPIYTVKDNHILVKGEWHHINLPDGEYVIRKLTPLECERLQTVPEGYTSAVSASQRFRGLGNGWTAEVIIHLLNGALGDLPRDTHIQVLSLYDGIGTGRYCLDKMGFTNVEYHAYEIDPYAMKVAMSNYPDIVQHGDAFQLRKDDWSLAI